MHVLGVDGSPSGGGRTAAVLSAVLDAAAAAGATTQLTSVTTEGERHEALSAAEAADAFVLGAPMYRASMAAPMKAFLDQMPRGMWGEATAPLTGRATAVVGTAASWHHFLGLGDLRDMLMSFFAAHVLPPGLYVPHEGFDGETLTAPFAARAEATGEGLVVLARAVAAAPVLAAVRPQA